MSAAPRLGPDDLALGGAHVRLVPLDPGHAPALAAAAAEGDLYRTWYTMVPAPAAMAAEIARRLALRAEGRMLPFCTLDATGRAVGMTTFMNIDAVTPRVEIGSTWIAVSAQRSALNTEAKALMLAQAFEVWGVTAVEFRTHRLNRQSRRAIERLGAQFDGLLRAHMKMPDGTLRDTAVYSITAPEWPTIRAHLAARLRAGA